MSEEAAERLLSWGSTAAGRLFTSPLKWVLSLEGDAFSLDVDGKQVREDVRQLKQVAVKPGILWARVRLDRLDGRSIELGAIPNASARRLKEAFDKRFQAIAHQDFVAEQIRLFGVELRRLTVWFNDFLQVSREQLRLRGWVSRESFQACEQSRPEGMERLLTVPEVRRHLEGLSANEQKMVEVWSRPLEDTVRAINQVQLNKQLVESRQFFDQVEKQPLTAEQAEAVVCFDSRVLLVASAGSGKTSTMVAKAGYALKNGYFDAEKMLLLAFNSDAAAELRERIKARLTPLGLLAEKVVAKTFHAFGLDVIGAATGKKPSLAPWVEPGRDLDALLSMVDELKDNDPAFRSAWDMFRLVFGQDLPKFGEEEEAPDAWDKQSKTMGFWTLKGDVVKSRGELVLANWLFYNGVNYLYEAPYKVETADAKHRQYQPDFYLPDADAYLEHWALDAKGEPPETFAGYKEEMAWKKRTHAENGTKLLETTMADLWSGRAFDYLSKELSALGIALDPNPDREVTGRRPIENPRLARTIRSFLTHAKSNRLTVDDLRKRLSEGVAGQFQFRHQMFLRIFERIWERWEERLRQEKHIDFEDMLNLAADHLEQGRYDSPYELVMVDEFQDASQARARLVAGLVRRPGRYLFAVGDDWQSINRFAGADLSVMTDFERYFGKAETLKLEATFRCGQALCDLSSCFVQKNPRQLKKNVRSSRPNVAQPVRIVSVPTEHEIQQAVEARVAEIAQEWVAGAAPATVYVLGRYNKDRDYLPRHFSRDKVSVEFITVHSSKGLEADHVILPRVTGETMGFPSRVADDPVLRLAMPGGEGFEFAEERRLFYVALTRARKTATLITLARKESSFVAELMKDFQLKVHNLDGTENSREPCPKCPTGFLVPRIGRFGPFFGCSNFSCDHTQSDPAAREERARWKATRRR